MGGPLQRNGVKRLTHSTPVISGFSDASSAEPDEIEQI
jgi:hypothetical protein